MDMTLAGFIALAALIVGLFAWLRQDIRELRKDIPELRRQLIERTDSIRQELIELRERVARIEGLLEAVFMRRDLTPIPEPPPADGRPDKDRAA